MYLDSTGWGTVQAKAANVHANDTNVPLVYLFNLGTPYRADGQDIVITTAADALIPRTISPVGDGTYVIYYRDPAQTTALGGTQLRVQWGGASVNVADDPTMWQNCHGGTDDYVLVVHGEETSANLIDATGNYTATDTDITYAQTGKILKAPQFIETASANFGPVSQLQNVSEFTITLWMNPSDIDKRRELFKTRTSSTNSVRAYTTTDGNLYTFISNGSVSFSGFDYSTVVTAGQYHMYTLSYNGGLIGDANRQKIFIDGVSQAQTYAGGVPSTTGTNTVDFEWSAAISGFLGEMDEFRIFTGALSSNQIITQYDNQNLFATNGSLNITGPFSASSTIYQSRLHNSISISI